MKNYILLALLVSTISYAQDNTTVKKVQKKKAIASKTLKVVNALDPICDMKTADHLSDTAVYKGKIYGFCSSHCKKEFKKSPAQYAKKK